MKFHTVIVLSDGDTYGELDGASICVFDDKTMQEIMEGRERMIDANPILEFGLKDWSPIAVVNDNPPHIVKAHCVMCGKENPCVCLECI